MSFLSRIVDLAVGRVGLGYRPDQADARDRPLSALAGINLAAPLPESVTYLAEAGALLNQGSTRSCVGHALASGLELAMKLAEQPSFPVSPWALWYWSRAAEGEESLDDGTHIRTAIKQAQVLGIPPEELWGRTKKQGRPPHDKQPSFACLRAAAKYRGLRGYHRIPSGDTHQIRHALAARKPVVFGLDVSRAFTGHVGTTLIDRDPDKTIGGHAMMCIGYRVVDGVSCFEVMNSWGRSWRNHGFAFLTARRMSEARDVWALDVQPKAA